MAKNQTAVATAEPEVVERGWPWLDEVAPPARVYDNGEPVSDRAPDEEKPSEYEARTHRNYERAKRWAGMSAQQRTQLASDIRYKDGRKWQCSIPANREQPQVTVRAASDDEARSRYLRLCGIQACDAEHQPVIAPVTE